jgi:hypothetical protein
MPYGLGHSQWLGASDASWTRNEEGRHRGIVNRNRPANEVADEIERRRDGAPPGSSGLANTGRGLPGTAL